MRYENRAKLDRKSAQLSAQVMEILNLSLADAIDEPLQSMLVEAVEAAADGRTLVVRVLVELETMDDMERASQSLHKASSYLRRQVAAGIVRKRTPELIFDLRPSLLGALPDAFPD